MYEKIMVPVDLAHVEPLDKALTTAADLAKHYGIPVCYVGVTDSAPSEVAHTPQEFAAKLEQFGQQQAQRHGHQVASFAVTSHDVAVDLDAKLRRVIGEVGADLVVMGSHVPGLPEHLFASNAGYVASHAKVSVLVVR
ncbi:MAG: universal stress protein [Candidatus Competibacterales bacterium]